MNTLPGDLPPHPALVGGPVYLDYNAITPVDPRVAEAMLPHLTGFFGNPSSSHPYGTEPQQALAKARAQVAAPIGADADGTVFTSSGSEADLLAIRGAVLASGRPRPHMPTASTYGAIQVRRHREHCHQPSPGPRWLRIARPSPRRDFQVAPHHSVPGPGSGSRSIGSCQLSRTSGSDSGMRCWGCPGWA
ncbi:hypothetical protein BSL84_29715 [Streptomyces sp. TN58]|nr:hypothetical protein BSL84_29715 [Streptomyces sp. TN58]